MVFIRPLSTAPPDSIDDRNLASAPHRHTHRCQVLQGLISAESWNEMVGLMAKHVTENHPDVAKQMERMHNEDPKKWGRETKPKWEATPEN